MTIINNERFVYSNRELPKVTLITIDGVGDKSNEISTVIDICTKKLNFGEVVRITTDHKLQNSENYTKYNIDKLTYPQFNAFCISKLTNYVKTEFALIVQTDGYVCQPNNWSNSFYDYDYIGCPWVDAGPGYFPWVTEPKYQVGCGGFCLRSKKLLDACAAIDNNLVNELTHRGAGEDVAICVSFRDYLESFGCKFPSGEFAKTFALGSAPVTIEQLRNTFGFHNGTYIPMVDEIIKSW